MGFNSGFKGLNQSERGLQFFWGWGQNRGHFAIP